MRRLAALALVLAAAAGSAAAALAGASPQARRAAILGAVDAKHSVHYVSRNQGGGRTVILDSDVGPGIGVQRVVFLAGNAAGSGTILIVHRTAYLRGDAFAMREFGFKKAQASRYAGQWISIPHSDRLYAPTAADATFASFAGDLLPNKNLESVTATVGGKKVQGVRGTAQQDGITFVETVYAPISGRPLPVEEIAASKPAGETNRVTISNWNEALHVKAPAHAVPISTVRGGGGGPIA
jgi:hypothetical protein